MDPERKLGEEPERQHHREAEGRQGRSQLLIGLTGSMGAGKTSVAEYLSGRGARVIDADQVAREVVRPGTPVLQAIARQFGQEVLSSSGSLNRKALADIVFSDQAQLEKLESIIHPPILSRIRDLVRSAREPLIVIDAVLLLETGLHREVDQVWVVTAPEAERIRRVAKRDGMSAQRARSRMARQMPPLEKSRYAHVIIDNGGSWPDTREQVDEALDQIMGVERHGGAEPAPGENSNEKGV